MKQTRYMAMYGTKCHTHYLECGKVSAKKLEKKIALFISIQKYFDNETMWIMLCPSTQWQTNGDAIMADGQKPMLNDNYMYIGGSLIA